MPVPQQINFIVGRCSEQRPERMIENGAISQF